MVLIFKYLAIKNLFPEGTLILLIVQLISMIEPTV